MSILGIDLGTTNSLACVWKGKEAILIPNAFGSYLTPSVVSFLENGEVLVGEGAKQRLHTHPSLTFAEFKRCMGTDTVYTAVSYTHLDVYKRQVSIRGQQRCTCGSGYLPCRRD